MTYLTTRAIYGRPFDEFACHLCHHLTRLDGPDRYFVGTGPHLTHAVCLPCYMLRPAGLSSRNASVAPQEGRP